MKQDLRVIHSSSERGASMVEFALVCPLLVLLFYGIVECLLFYRTIASLNRVAAQGASIGMSVPGLADWPGSYVDVPVSNGLYGICSQDPNKAPTISSTGGCPHLLIHYKARNLANAILDNGQVSNIHVESALIGSQVEVKVSAEYRSLFGVIAISNLTAKDVQPYHYSLMAGDAVICPISSSGVQYCGLVTNSPGLILW